MDLDDILGRSGGSWSRRELEFVCNDHFKRKYKAFHRTAIGMLKNREDAEDAIQETYRYMFSKNGWYLRYDPLVHHLDSRISTCLICRCLDSIRARSARSHTRPFYENEDGESEESSFPDPGAHHAAEEKLLVAEAMKAFATTLTDREQTAVRMWLADCSSKEIARALGMPGDHPGSTVPRALKKLRDRLESEACRRDAVPRKAEDAHDSEIPMSGSPRPKAR
jgi:RNA polymerase sigma factor (sigma-70 family)